MSSILGIGKSALAAAQAGLATTGHNIANASTPGYSRQVVVQASAGSQNMGGGFVGKGTEVVDVRRVYSDLLAGNVRNSQSMQNQVQTWYTQINQINNLLADSAGALSPALQNFFKGVQNLASYPNESEARQSVLSNAQTLASRFQAMDSQMRELGDNINGQIESSVTLINTYAQQIAKLNEAIEQAQGMAGGKAPNDLLDQRDHALSELSKEIKTTVVQQGNSYNVFIGNGQPVVVGKNVYELSAVASAQDPLRTVVGYTVNGKDTELAEGSITGGKLGGLIEFRSKSLDPAINSLGRIAIGLAMSFNAQHKLGVDQTGAPGGNFFTEPRPSITRHHDNSATAPDLSARISDPTALGIDDYQLEYLGGGNYAVTNLTTNQRTSGSFDVATAAIKGITIDPPGAGIAAGDKYLIRPTRDGAAEFSLAIAGTTQIAAAAGVAGEASVGNAGTAKMSAVNVSSSLLTRDPPFALTYAGGNLVGLPADQKISVYNTVTDTTTTYPAGTTSVPYGADDTITIGGVTLSGIPLADGTYPMDPPWDTTLTYDGATGSLSGFPDNSSIRITHADGTTTDIHGVDAATSVPYREGDTFSFAGVSFTMTGAPSDGDTFKLNRNATGIGDNRNAVALGNLQTARTMPGGTTYQGAYAQLVSTVGNKTRELEVTNTAETTFLRQAEEAMQAESGVNLDEEAAQLMRYQQAYQAAARVMQTASQMFEMLLTIGG